MLFLLLSCHPSQWRVIPSNVPPLLNKPPFPLKIHLQPRPLVWQTLHFGFHGMTFHVSRGKIPCCFLSFQARTRAFKTFKACPQVCLGQSTPNLNAQKCLYSKIVTSIAPHQDWHAMRNKNNHHKCHSPWPGQSFPHVRYVCVQLCPFWFCPSSPKQLDYAAWKQAMCNFERGFVEI